MFIATKKVRISISSVTLNAARLKPNVTFPPPIMYLRPTFLSLFSSVTLSSDSVVSETLPFSNLCVSSLTSDTKIRHWL